MPININMGKARTIHLAEIRRVRDAELVRLDESFLRAVESGDTEEQAAIADMKQTLRDIPQVFNIGSASTPTQLKARWPSILPNRTD